MADMNGAITKMRVSDGTVVGRFQLTGNLSAIAFDGANTWVTNITGNYVTKMRASDGVILGTFAVGLRPSAIAFDGVNMWVTNSGDGTVSKL